MDISPKMCIRDSDDIDRCNWNIAPFTYTQSAGEGTPVDGREFVKGKRDEGEQQYWDKSFSYGKTEPGSTYGDRESKNDANKNRNRAQPHRQPYMLRGLEEKQHKK